MAQNSSKPRLRLKLQQATFHGVYISVDPVNGYEARQLGYRAVLQHPIEVTDLSQIKFIVIDYDAILFDDRKAADQLVQRAVEAGIHVGLHSYNHRSPLTGHPYVLTAQSHLSLRAEYRSRRLRQKKQRTDTLSVPAVGSSFLTKGEIHDDAHAFENRSRTQAATGNA